VLYIQYIGRRVASSGRVDGACGILKPNKVKAGSKHHSILVRLQHLEVNTPNGCSRRSVRLKALPRQIGKGLCEETKEAKDE